MVTQGWLLPVVVKWRIAFGFCETTFSRLKWKAHWVERSAFAIGGWSPRDSTNAWILFRRPLCAPRCRLWKVASPAAALPRCRAAAAKYTHLLAGLDLKLPVEADFARHVYRAYLIMVTDRDRVRDNLAERGVATRVYYSPPLHLQPVYAHMGFRLGSFPATERAGEQMVGLPIFPEITDQQIERTVTAVRECVRGGS